VAGPPSRSRSVRIREVGDSDLRGAAVDPAAPRDRAAPLWPPALREAAALDLDRARRAAPLDDPVVRQALATPRGRAIAQFARFLAADVDSSGGGLRVWLRDARYNPTGRSGSWAAVEVRLR